MPGFQYHRTSFVGFDKNQSQKSLLDVEISNEMGLGNGDWDLNFCVMNFEVKIPDFLH